MIRLLIFGTGRGYHKLKLFLNYKKVEIIALIDNDPSKKMQSLDGKKIISPIEINDYTYDYIIIASQFVEEIHRQLNNINIPIEKIISFYSTDFKSSNYKDIFFDSSITNGVRCPCCKGEFHEFLPYGVKQRLNALCPKCGSLERHRLLWLYLKKKTNLFEAKLHLLHFAPERIFQEVFESAHNLNYISADLYSPKAMFKMDITNIKFDNDWFDVIICNHVLEHVEDDQKAMGELYRVLKKGGWGIIQSPVDYNREYTYEDKNVILPEERERLFGQRDHVRVYGKDYMKKLKKVGFHVKVKDGLKLFGRKVCKEYRLGTEKIYLCIKK